jgi:hypothetical protein
VLALLAACSGHGTVANNSGAEDPSWAQIEVDEPPPVGTFVIELLSEPDLTLGVGEESVITVRATDMNDEPVSDLRLSFALIGVPKDASLEKLDATTDERGIASNTLITGQMSTTFALRISTPGAADVPVFAAVSGEGWGSLMVRAPYEGRRQVAQRLVFAQPFVKCEDASKTLGVQPGTVDLSTVERGTDKAIVEPLPAGVDFAVMAVAEGQSGTTLAYGCTDGVRVSPDAETRVQVDFADEPFKPAGQFNVKAELDAQAPARTLAGALEAAATADVERDADGQRNAEDAEARFLLDVFLETLNDAPYAEQADAMELRATLEMRRAEMTAETPESTLQDWLDRYATGPLVATERIADAAEDSLAAMQLFAAITLDASQANQPVVWQARRIQARPTVTGGSPPSIDLARRRVAADTDAEFIVDDDLLSLSSVSFRAELGALGVEVLRRVTSSISEGDDEHPDPFGCTALGTWLTGPASLETRLTDACDADCLRASCDRAVARITEAAEAALLELDDERPTLVLHADLALHDDDGDLIADSMVSDEMSGEWPRGSESTDDEVSGSALATAITDSDDAAP